MKIKVIYIAGPYKGIGRDETERNIELARIKAVQVWKMGFAAFCPHLNTRGFEKEGIPDDMFYMGDIEILKKCDAVLMIGDWKGSRGAFAEYTAAKALGIMVFEDVKILEEYKGAW